MFSHSSVITVFVNDKDFCLNCNCKLKYIPRPFAFVRMCNSVSVLIIWDHTLHTYKVTGKMVVLYILVFKIVESVQNIRVLK